VKFGGGAHASDELLDPLGVADELDRAGGRLLSVRRAQVQLEPAQPGLVERPGKGR
jgi:hypothetical protein